MDLVETPELRERQQALASGLLDLYNKNCKHGYHTPPSADLATQKLTLGGPQDRFLLDILKNVNKDELKGAGFRDGDSDVLREFTKETPGISAKEMAFIRGVISDLKFESHRREQHRPLPIGRALGKLHELPGYKVLYSSSIDSGHEYVWVVSIDNPPENIKFQAEMTPHYPYCICWNPKCEASVRNYYNDDGYDDNGFKVAVAQDAEFVELFGEPRPIISVKCSCCEAITIIAKE